MSVYRASRLPGRHRARRVRPAPGPLRRYLRRAWAVAFNAGGLLALVLAVLVGDDVSCALRMTALGAVLILAGTWLALPPGEAWARVTGGAS